MKRIRKNCKAIISLILSAIIIFSCTAMAFAESEENYPVIYISGQGGALARDENGIKEKIYPIEIPDGYIGDRAKELIVPLGVGIATGNYEKYGAGLYDAVMPFFEYVACDEKGCVPEGTGALHSSSTSPSKIRPNSSLNVWAFNYDWRLDPTDCADALHDYISYVKSKTASAKINIIARCLGTDIILAYADKYGMSDVKKCLLCCLGFDGFETIGAIFSGEIKLDGDALECFSDSYLSVEDYADDPTFELIRQIITVLQATPLIGLTAEAGNKFIDGIHDNAYKNIIRDAVGTTPSYWCYIGDDYYEKAKAFLFGGEEEKYSELIEKIDFFHYEILNNYSEILDSIENDGTYIYNVCKYGFQMIPVLGADYEMSDSIISSKRSSLGATFSDVDKTLSREYLMSANPKYISPDNQVDASTCRYPEHTWFIKNMTHRNMPGCIDDVFSAILSTNGYATVDDVDGYPQFIMSSDDGKTLSPATAENSSITIDRMNESPVSALIKILMKFIKLIVEKLFIAQ